MKNHPLLTSPAGSLSRRTVIKTGFAGILAGSFASGRAFAGTEVKLGQIQPMTGPS